MSELIFTVRDVTVAAFLLGGAFFMLVAGIGLMRFPDVYTRMHAAGKAGTLGVALLILAPTVYFAASEPWLSIRGCLAILFQGLTTPSGTHLLAQACYITSHPTHSHTRIDELKGFMPVYPDDEFGPE